MKRIMLVDDQEDNNYYLRVLLEGHGYEIDVAREGTEALRRSRIHPPDLVVSDLLMPVMDGFTLLRHWMQDHQLKNIPFMVYTATYREPEDEKLALSLGAKRYLLKPMEVDDILHVVREVLAGEETEDQPANEDVWVKEADSSQSYNEHLIRKLEGRVIAMEEANQALREEIAKLKEGRETSA